MTNTAPQSTARLTSRIESAVTAGLLLLSILIIGLSLPVVWVMLRNLSLAMMTGLACIGCPSWVC